MSDAVTCPNGHECPAGSAFCNTCGAPLAVVPAAPVEPGASEPVVTLIATPPEMAAAPDGADSATGPGRPRWLVVGAVAVVVFALLGVAAFVLVSRGSSHPSYGAVGTVVIKPTLEDAGSFVDGLAAAKRDGKWGFIDPAGTFVIAPQFDDASGFSEGLAPVELGEEWGFIDTSGAIVITPQYSFLKYSMFSGGLTPVRKDEKYGYIDTTGAMKIAPQFDTAYDFSEDLAPVEMGDKWGYIDPTGKLVIATQYDYAYPFAEGRAAVSIADKWGFIDPTGAFVSNPQFSDAWSFTSGYAAVASGGKWGYINRSGEWSIPAEFEKAYGFSEGLAAVMKDGKWGYITTAGDFAIEPTFDVKPMDLSASDPYYRISNFFGGLASVMPADGTKEGLIDPSGRWALQPTYPSIYACSEGLAGVATNTDTNGFGDGPWGYISCG